MTTGRSIVFTHVPRTAGSSIHYAFLRTLGADRAHVLDTPLLLPQRRAAIDRADREGQLYLGGHFSLDDVASQTSVDPGRTVNFVTLRDPLERFLSHHALIQSSAAATDLPALRPTTVAEFIAVLERHGRSRMIDNPHCVTLCGAADFERARAAILDRYDYAALSGQAAALVDLVAECAQRRPWPGGWPELPDTPHNAAARDPLVAPSAADLRRLQPFFAEDRKLFDWVKRQGGLVKTGRTPGAAIRAAHR